jgi:hypothetical protein
MSCECRSKDTSPWMRREEVIPLPKGSVGGVLHTREHNRHSPQQLAGLPLFAMLRVRPARDIPHRPDVHSKRAKEVKP